MSSSVTGSNGVVNPINKSGPPKTTYNGASVSGITGGGAIIPPIYNRPTPNIQDFATAKAKAERDPRRRKGPR
jgi:hypothetical protein